MNELFISDSIEIWVMFEFVASDIYERVYIPIFLEKPGSEDTDFPYL